ncbi:MAG: hypothetical protein AAFX02_00870 [Pseudomonadota bacterium]
MRADDPRIDDLIKSEQFHHFEGTKAVTCCAVLHNGHHLVAHAFKGDRSPSERERVEQHLSDQVRRVYL